MRAISAAGICVILLSAPLQAAEGETLRLVGHVIDQDNRPVPRARIRLVPAGTSDADDSGEFRIVIPNDLNTVTVVLLAPEGLVLMHPRGGYLPIPRGDPPPPITLLVGRSTKDTLLEALGNHLARVETTVRNQADPAYDVLTTIDATTTAILEQLEQSSEDVRRLIDTHKEKIEAGTTLKRILLAYLREIRDLADAIDLLGRTAAHDPASLMALHTALEQYNAAFTELHDRQGSVETLISGAWEPAIAEALRTRLSDVYAVVLERIHERRVLPLNEPLVVLQRNHGKTKPSRSEIADAEKAIRSGSAAIQLEIPELSRRIDDLAATLDRN